MIASLVRLMRPGDWLKNVFVLVALVFSLPAMIGAGEAIDPLVVDTALAFVAFSLLASGFYAVNDVLDAERDRAHPVKQHRPVASGQVRPGQAVAFGVVLIGLALVVAGLVNTMLVATLLLYAVLHVAYNARMKRMMFVDVVVIAAGFALRATAGAVAIDVQISIWLLLCVFFLCLYLGFIKRLCDLSSAAAATTTTIGWESPAGYNDRSELNWLLGVSAVLAVVTYLMYGLSEHAWALFGSRSIGFALLTPLVMITIHRFYRTASAGTSDSPLAALREDRVVLACIALFTIGVAVTLFVPPVQRVLDQLFIAGVESNGRTGEAEGPLPGEPPE